MPMNELPNDSHSVPGDGHGAAAPFITVFTPTYNRAHTLARVYESLLHQTNKNFEWIVIDDGSTDGTESLVKPWIGEAPFEIRYSKQANAGKHIAWNRALDMARGKYFICLDSDDAFVPQTIEVLEQDLGPKFGGQDEVDCRAFLLIGSSGEPLGNDLADSDFDKSYSELFFENKLYSDSWFVFRTPLLRQFAFPECFRNFCFPESFVFYAFDKTYPIKFAHNQRLGQYNRDSNDKASLMNSISFGRLRYGAALNLYLMHLSVLNSPVRYFSRAPSKFVRSGINYVRFRIWAGKGLGPFIREIESGRGRLLAVLGIVPGICMYLIDHIRLALHSGAR